MYRSVNRSSCLETAKMASVFSDSGLVCKYRTIQWNAPVLLTLIWSGQPLGPEWTVLLISGLKPGDCEIQIHLPPLPPTDDRCRAVGPPDRTGRHSVCHFCHLCHFCYLCYVCHLCYFCFPFLFGKSIRSLIFAVQILISLIVFDIWHITLRLKNVSVRP